ncbi:aminoglycoside 3'-phosphotransferase [Actinopolymorpha singaporensis]|uniref:aminoglycoside 3'-phosphotransferase n=1 Tax=Actinopolymorpha singaporensis TaxID=117157 RepID=UPI000A76CB3A|nr:aminoglycoside 3'-phosphotransferase [Actinopolymorpha singaporensis]
MTAPRVPDSESPAHPSTDPDHGVDIVEVPPVVATIAAGDPIRLVWRNDLGGRTYRLDRSGHTEYVKWAPDHPEIDLEQEARKLAWAGRYTVVPEVLGLGRDTDHSAWLHTLGIPAMPAVAPRWKADPRRAARAIGTGLRMFHERLPVSECPWSWRIRDRSTRIRNPDDMALLDVVPEEDHLVVCHGDPCVPNTLIGPDGNCAGHVDLGSLGVADRWADLAVATYSLPWNYSPAYEDELLDAYGIERDGDRISYYRRLWDAT